MTGRAACEGRWWLFDSTHPGDHLAARAICRTCPIFYDCAITAATLHRAGPNKTSTLEGTWAGQLYGATARSRIRAEDDMFTDDDARFAHAAYERTPKEERTRSGVGDRVITGERVYQRRKKRGRDARRGTA